MFELQKTIVWMNVDSHWTDKIKWRINIEVTMEDGHCKTVEEVLEYFSVDPDKGLSIDQVKRNQEKYGLNGK